MSDTKIGIGILGTAAIARKNIRAIKLARNNLEVVAVGSRSKEKAGAYIREVEGAEGAVGYGSYEEVIEDENVHAVYIPLPTSMHLKWVQAAAAKGKHILLEKPIAMSNEEMDAILKACSDANVQFMDGRRYTVRVRLCVFRSTGTMWMHNPRALHMRSVLDDARAVGRLRSVTSSFAFPGSEDFMKGNIRVAKELDGLGCLGDMGWYCIRAILWAFSWDLPHSVQATPGCTFTPTDVPLHTSATLLFDKDRSAFFECGFDRAAVQYLEVAGTSGTVRVEDFVIPRNEKVAQFQVRDGQFLADNATRVSQAAEERTVYLDRPQETLMWEAFGKCIRAISAGGSPEEWWPKLAAITNRVVLAVEESVRNGCKPVQLT